MILLVYHEQIPLKELETTCNADIFYYSGMIDIDIYPHYQEQHSFAEGPDMLISDLLLYPCFHLVYARSPGLRDTFPLTSR